MVTELSYARINSIRLQLALRRLIKTVDEVQIQFNADKSEYIHFHKGRDSIDIEITYYYYYYTSISACSPRAGTDNIHICAPL
jgi:hypothetical protein